MTSLLTITELSVALGREIDTEEEPQAQYLIDATSSYIESVTELSFSLVEDATERFMANYYGELVITPGPVQDVSELTAVNYSTPVWYWDGMDTVYYLYPNQVVDITYSYGYTTIPADIKAVATEMVKAVIDSSSGGSLKSKQIGDVQYAFQEMAVNNFQGLGSDTLDLYMPLARTERLGRGFPNPYGGYP